MSCNSVLRSEDVTDEDSFWILDANASVVTRHSQAVLITNFMMTV